MPLEEKNIRQLLKRYLLGNGDEKDNNVVDNWYESFDNEELVTLSAAEAAATKQEIWDKIQPVVTPERKVWTLSRPLKAAAMVILIAGAAGAFLLLRRGKAPQTPQMAFTTISTGVGERKKITMQEGSQLLLDAGTTIMIQKDLSRDRKIELVDGQVFVEVKKDDERPFRVESEGLTTTVLGTSFNISAYKALNKVSIGVISGKVSVASEKTTLSVLEKDQELVFNKRSKTFTKIPLDESLTAWQDGRLMLNDLSFYEMAAIMQKNYGIEIETTTDAILHTRYTTELLSAMTPTQAAEVLAAIHNLKLRKKGNKILLYK